MLNRNMLRQSLALALLALASSAVSAQEVGIPAANVPVQGVVGETEFPVLDRATLRQGDYVNVGNLRQVGRGLSKSQVRRLLGNPHFSEGIAGVSRWNYIFNFRTGPESHVTCQYQLNFERESGRYLVDTIHWDGPACLDALNASPEPVKTRILSADALFAFDRSGVADILEEGRAEVAALAEELKEDGQAHITVVGHADRLGDAAYNQALSEQRALTVRQLLIEDGIPAERISAYGRGSTEPVTICDAGLAHAGMIECLRPDRRVEIQVGGQR